MSTTEKRRAAIINIIYFAIIVSVYCLFLKYAFGIVAPFVFAFAIAMFLQKPIRVIHKKTKIKKAVIGVVAVILILSILISLLVLVGYRIAVEFKGFGNYIMQKAEDLPNLIRSAEAWINNSLHFLPDGIEKTATDAVSDFADKLLLATKNESEIQAGLSSGFADFDLSVLVTPLGGLLSTAKQIPTIVTATLIGIIACFFITCDYDNFTSMIKRNVSEKHEHALVRTKHLLIDILGKMCKSYLTIMFVTFCEVSIGLNLMKLIGIYTGGYILVIAICTAVVDILPVFGTGTVMIPWAVVSLFTGKTGLGIGLLVLYGIITVIRQILEPRLVAMNVDMPPIITLAGMYIGLQLFGVLGLFIIPITFVLIKALNNEGIIHLYGRKNAPDDGSDNDKNDNSDSANHNLAHKKCD